MTYFVKRCARCGAINHPAEVQCLACADLLPLDKIASDSAPPNPSERAARAALRAATQPRDAASVATFTRPDSPIPVIIRDIRMPFWSVFDLSTRFILAAIPAALFAAFIIFGTLFTLVGLLGLL